MYKVAEVAQQLNCSPSTVYALLESGRLGYFRCPGIRISEEQLSAYLQRAAQRARPTKLKVETRTRPRLRHIRLA